jgi:hypothetical protein
MYWFLIPTAVTVICLAFACRPIKRDFVNGGSDEAMFRVALLIPILAAWLIYFVVIHTMAIGFGEIQPQEQPASSLAAHAEHLASDGFGASHSEHTRTIDGQAVNGFSYGNGFQITWQSQQAPTGATVLDVLEAVQSRLLHMQKTKLGGDEVARAIWDVGKAIESLSGPLKDGKSGGGAGFIQPK